MVDISYAHSAGATVFVVTTRSEEFPSVYVAKVDQVSVLVTQTKQTINYQLSEVQGNTQSKPAYAIESEVFADIDSALVAYKALILSMIP